MSSNWENKLFNYQAEPPASAWDAIAGALNEQQASYPDKLYNYLQAPPTEAWQKIEAQLQHKTESTGAKVVPMSGFKKVARYAAAAIVLLAVIGIAYFAAPNNQQQTASGTVNNNLLNNTPATPPAKREIKHFNVPPQVASKTSKSTKSGPQYASNTRPAAKPRQLQTNLPVEPIFASNELNVVPQQKNIVDTDRTDRYMIATSDEGTPVRLPKKVYSAFACPEDDPRQKACELQLTLLQNKMSASLTTDFAHFLDLLKNLQENSR